MNSKIIKQYIEDNAYKFEFTALLNLLRKIGYSLNDVQFIPLDSLSSQIAYINSVDFFENKVRITVSDLFIADFLNKVEYETNYNPELKFFFILLFEKLLFNLNMSVYPEGYYNNISDFLCTRDDIYIKSYSFLYNYLKHLFSDYDTFIYLKDEAIDEYFQLVILGKSKLESENILGGCKRIMKTFIVIRIITESKLSDREEAEIKSKLNRFLIEFSPILSEINIILNNYILDQSLYSIIPFRLTHNSFLLQSINRIITISRNTINA